MPSLYCPRCGLRTRLTTASLVLENCPRCMAHRGAVEPLIVTPPIRAAAAGSVPSDAHPASGHPGS
jgi:hypothetical protein